jgi:hypothetical protein
VLHIQRNAARRQPRRAQLSGISIIKAGKTQRKKDGQFSQSTHVEWCFLVLYKVVIYMNTWKLMRSSKRYETASERRRKDRSKTSPRITA